MPDDFFVYHIKNDDIEEVNYNTGDDFTDISENLYECNEFGKTARIGKGIQLDDIKYYNLSLSNINGTKYGDLI